MPKEKGEFLMEIASLDFNEAENKVLENTSLVTQLDSNQRLLLHWAALLGKDRLVELLLKFKECEVDSADDTGATPLILATLKGALNICKMLVEKGANVNHANTNGHTAVQYAGSKNHKEIMAFLLDSKADPNTRDHIGDTPLHRVASMERHECLQILLTHPNSSGIISIDSQNRQGNTALHLACECDDSTTAMLLLDMGACTEIQNKQKQTALDLCEPGLRRKISERVQQKAN